MYMHGCVVFRRADDRYNSGLFHFQKEKRPLRITRYPYAGVTIDDKVLRDIMRNLYYPDSPYEFSVLSVDILGQVYEQFLGKVIRLTEGHRAVVEEKPEVRKAGGVYYTPTYIVDYIVKNTVGKLLECGLQNDERAKIPLSKGGKGVVSLTPKEAAKIRILDPACGSGSFLLGAFQYLLDYHRDWYVANEPEKWATGRSPALYQASGGDWRLTTAERKRILLNNIYGVDIDPQAVEVTKLSAVAQGIRRRI
ncbi:MAG: DNA methyltransferase [Candidatus Brocadiaceae bacterium]